MIITVSRVNPKPPFPKLMKGKNTGTIYLATESIATMYGMEYRTIVLDPKTQDQKVGEVNRYLLNLLEDFDGEVTLRNL